MSENVGQFQWKHHLAWRSQAPPSQWIYKLNFLQAARASDRFEHTIIVRRDCNYYYCAGQSYFSKGAMPQDVPRLQVASLFFIFAFVITILGIHWLLVGIDSKEHYWQMWGNETHKLKSVWCNFVVMIDPVCILILCTLSERTLMGWRELRRSDSCEDGMAGGIQVNRTQHIMRTFN